MISFIWPVGPAMLAGTGGSETYTAGHIRELLRRGIAAQVVTVGLGTDDGRKDFTDIPFVALKHSKEISELDGMVVFVNSAYKVPTKKKAAIILHVAPTSLPAPELIKNELKGKIIIATSIFAGQQWALFLGIPYSRIHVVLPFADPIFGKVKRSKPTKKTRITYAGRLHPGKGIYTVLEMMHHKEMRHNGYVTSLVTAGQHSENGRTIAKMLEGYPYAKLIDAKKTVLSMAQLLAESDILIVPSVCEEAFGMLSIEAQHAGCRVVASNIGGIPETNSGLLTLVEPRDPLALITGIEHAVALGQATKKERDSAKEHFTLNRSVDSLLDVLRV